MEEHEVNEESIYNDEISLIEPFDETYTFASSQDQGEEEQHEEGYVQQLAQDVIHDLIMDAMKITETTDELYVHLDENDQITAFVQDTLGALADDISMGAREYVSHDEAYFWMTYFFLHFCGFRIFFANIDNIIEHEHNMGEFAEMIVELVDEVAENAPYLHKDSDVPEHIAKSIIWQMLNSRMMMRRFTDKGVAMCHVEDILDEILENVVTHPPLDVEVSERRETIKEKDYIVRDTLMVEEPYQCREFGGIFKVAEYFVNSLLEESAVLAKKTRAKSITEPWSIIGEDDEGTKATKGDKHISIIPYATVSPFGCKLRLFPSIQSFTIKEGKRAILDIIQMWKRCYLYEDWYYSIKFIMGQSDACSDFFTYEAKFGLPTPLYPVAQATCSIFFKIEVSRVKPPLCPVNITYKIEGSGYEHVPEEYEFREDWLIYVINAKLRLYCRLQF